jgi:thiol-disulfide isomerase/thioredoxin
VPVFTYCAYMEFTIMNLRSVLSLAAAFCISAVALGQEKKLSVGDAAPGLDIERWVKGQETTIKQGQVYVVEFWATWCGPCRQSIPHLTELQKAYADDGLTIIGVSTDSEIDKVAPFVRGQGEKMGYTVAIDRHGGTARAWMQAAGKSGIPCAFIVDQKSRIAWIGNPHPLANEGFEEALRQVMSGRFDPKLQRQAEPVLQAARSARKVRNWMLASKHYDDVVDLDPRVFANIGLEKFEMLLVDMDDRDRAYEYARGTLLGQKFASDAGALQMLAEKIATDAKIDQPKRDLDLALEAADAAHRLAGRSDPKALAVLATVRFQRGEMEEAIELQKRAYFSASPKTKPNYQRTLRTYQDAARRAALTSSR